MARRQVAAAAVADEGHATGGLGVAGVPRPQVPGDRVAVGAAEATSKASRPVGAGRVAFDRGQGRGGARRRDRRRPERVETGRLGDGGAVLAQPAQRQVEEGRHPGAVKPGSRRAPDARSDDRETRQLRTRQPLAHDQERAERRERGECDEITAATAIPWRAPSS